MILSGILGADIGGVAFAVEESGEYSPQTREYDEIAISSGFGGLTGKGVVPYLQFTVRLDQTQTSDQLNVRRKTIILRCEDRTVTLSNGNYVGKLSVDGGKNSVKCKFVGDAVTEVLS